MTSMCSPNEKVFILSKNPDLRNEWMAHLKQATYNELYNALFIFDNYVDHWCRSNWDWGIPSCGKR